MPTEEGEVSTAAKLIGSEVSWSSVSVAIEVCGKQGHKFVQFGSMGNIVCEHCGLTLTQIHAGTLTFGDNNASST